MQKETEYYAKQDFSYTCFYNLGKKIWKQNDK